jgi:methionyl-tRNA formyltransferase
MKLVFCGTGSFGIPALRRLVERGQAPSLVVAQPDRPQGRHGTPKPPEFAAAAAELGLPLFQPERINRPEALARIANEQPEVIVVAAYGQILKQPLLQMPRFGCVNIHGSLLPRHRGASPVQGALLAGDAETGTTLMLMDEGLDTGAILAARKTSIGAEETAAELHDRLAVLGGEMLLPVLEDLLAGRAQPQAQDAACATHCGLIAKEEGLLHWERPASENDRRIRAFTPWPGAWTFLADGAKTLRLSVLKARPVEGRGAPGARLDQPGLVIACGDGALKLESVQPAGGRPMEAAAFLRGRDWPVGLRCTAVPR